MPFEIPAASNLINFEKPYLTPQILADIQLEDITQERANINPVTGNSENPVTYYVRVANIEIQLLYIRHSTLRNALDKAISTIKNSITNHLNPESSANTQPLPLDTDRASIPKMQFAIQGDNTYEVKTVNVWIQIKNLKVSFVQETLASLTNYVVNAVEVDMNEPS